jgi:hypothetical protein
MAVFEYYVWRIDPDIAAGGLRPPADSSRNGTVDQPGYKADVDDGDIAAVRLF